MSETLPAEKNLSDSSRSSSSDSVATGASSDRDSPPNVRESSKTPPSDLQTIHEGQPLQVSPSPAPGDGDEAVGQQNQRPRSATGQSSIQHQQQNIAIDNQELPEPQANAALEPDIVIQNLGDQSDSDEQDDLDDAPVADEEPLLEEHQIDDPPHAPRQFTFSLIRPFATKHWSCCSTIYTIVFLVFIVALLAALTCITFWAVEMSKIKERTITVSTHEVSNLSGLTIPNDHFYSERLCINVPKGHDPPIHGTRVKLVAKSECDKVTLMNDKYIQPEDYTPVPYVFYLRAGSKINVSLQVSSGNVEVFLLIEEDVCEQCIFGNIPEEQLRVNETGGTGSRHIWYISSPNHYYLCFCTNDTAEANYSYSLEIDPLVRFNLTGPNISNSTCNDLATGQKNCCLSYANIFRELQSETCIFVETSIGDPYLVDYFKLTVSSQTRLSVLWYSLGLLAVCAMIVVVLALLCVMTWRKVRNPDLPGCRLTLICNCQLYPGQD